MSLKGVVIDPGHGGADSGAVGNGITEKDLTLKISKYMLKRLNDLGISATITRDDDSDLTSIDRTKKILSEYGNDSNVVVVSNHINAGGVNGQSVTNV